MVEKFNSIAAANKHRHPGCDLRAVHGDLIDRYNLRPDVDPRITDPDGDYQSFDLVVMCVSFSTLENTVFHNTESNVMGILVHSKPSTPLSQTPQVPSNQWSS